MQDMSSNASIHSQEVRRSSRESLGFDSSNAGDRENEAESNTKTFVLQRTGRRSTTRFAETGKEESSHDQTRTPSPAHATTLGRSSKSQVARLIGATSSAAATPRDQGLSDSRASSRPHKSRLASLKSETQSRMSRRSSSTSDPRGSEKTVLSLRVHSNSPVQSGANCFCRARNSMAPSHSRPAEDLASPLHSVQRDKATHRCHSEEPDVQKLPRGSTSSSAEIQVPTLASAIQRRGSSGLHSGARRRGSMMSTATDLSVAASSGSAMYGSEVKARQASQHKDALANSRPRSTDSRQSTQSNQPAEARVPGGTGQSLRSGLVAVFSAFTSLLGLLVSVQTYVSLVMAPSKFVAACLSSQPPWSGEQSVEDGRRRPYRKDAKGSLESQRRRSSTEDMWAMEALALNYDFTV